MVRDFLSVNVAEVTTDDLIQVDQGTAVVSPVTSPRGTDVVSAHAPDQTVGPGIGYVVVQDVVIVLFVSVEQ